MYRVCLSYSDYKWGNLSFWNRSRVKIKKKKENENCVQEKSVERFAMVKQHVWIKNEKYILWIKYLTKIEMISVI